jgi:F-box/leucine-rich repeat protein 16
LQVCKRWREVLYQPPFWRDLRPVLRCRDLRAWNTTEEQRAGKRALYLSIKQRGYDNVCLLNANDADVFDFIQNYPQGAKDIHTLSLRCCNLTDRGLEALLEFLQGLYALEINGCNEISEQGLWSALQPRLVSLTVTDCINVADECICAITQLLPALIEFNLQVR